MRRIIIADNQNITSFGLRYLIQLLELDVEVLDVLCKKDLLDRLQQNNDVLVVLDYTLFDFESANELIVLNSKYPKTDWLLFSDELSDDFLINILYNTNSFGVVLKYNAGEEIQTAIRESLKSRRYICNHVSNVLLDMTKRNNESKRHENKLTITEQEILREIALGKTTKEIASLRFVSSHTIMTHRKNIFRKLNVNNIHEATKYAMRAGIVDMAEYYI
ncbi:MAG: response regulator transcription factor [Paludibacter sp.]|nr:response regulator transcription factor [Paludibacter sp.]